MYCLFSMNFNFLKKNKKNKLSSNCKLKKNISLLLTCPLIQWHHFKDECFSCSEKVYNTVLFHADPFLERKHHLCSNTVSYWVVWITSQQHVQWNQKAGKHKMNKYLKWIKKDVILQFWELVYYKWMNICCLARSPSSPPLSPLQATRQQHSAGRSKLNTRPRGGALLPFDL